MARVEASINELGAPSRNVASMISASQRSASLTAPGDFVNLAVGEPDFAPAQHVVEEMQRALDAGYTHYADLAGDIDLREAAVREHAAESVIQFDATQVQVTAGATAGLAATILGITSPGDRIILPSPTYSLYADLVRMAGGEVIGAPLTDDHHFDLEALRAVLPGARALVYCNPGNPTGAVHDRTELEALGVALAGTGTIVVDDAAYRGLVYPGYERVPALSVEGLAERSITCHTFSKQFAMTGFRIGYVIAPGELITSVSAVHRTFNGSVNAAVQRAALAALSGDRQHPTDMMREYGNRRDFVASALRDIPQLSFLPPEGAFYFFPKILTGHADSTVAARALEHGVKIRAGSEFGTGGQGYLRISFATSEKNLELGLSRLKHAMATLV